MACTGLRRCEALRLRLGDLDAVAETLRVPGVKSSPPRLIPLHPTTVRALVRYRQARQRVFPLTDHFFVGRKGQPPHPTLVDWNFRQLVHGMVPTGDRAAVRLVDLRHTFATRLIDRWSRQAQPVAHHLLLLARYLGHQNFHSIWWYVSADPQALAVAARRFQRYHGRRDPRAP